MLCPSCGWEAKEVKLTGRHRNGGYTCDNATCEMNILIFTVHILGTRKELDGIVSNGNGFEEGEWQ